MHTNKNLDQRSQRDFRETNFKRPDYTQGWIKGNYQLISQPLILKKKTLYTDKVFVYVTLFALKRGVFLMYNTVQLSNREQKLKLQNSHFYLCQSLE